VPTDPFVAPDLDDRPRQQQNLPPGLGYPPARGWRPTRPGDQTAMAIGTATPEGALRGRPGPNVGYAYTLAGRIRGRFKLGPHEHSEDAVSVVAEVAMKRAAALGRAPVMPDIELAVEILGYDGNVDDDFASWRARAVHDAAHHYPVRRAIVDSVPDMLLGTGPVGDRPTAIAAWRRSAQVAVDQGDLSL
jgi:hypothetical protein